MRDGEVVHARDGGESLAGSDGVRDGATGGGDAEEVAGIDDVVGAEVVHALDLRDGDAENLGDETEGVAGSHAVRVDRGGREGRGGS